MLKRAIKRIIFLGIVGTLFIIPTNVYSRAVFKINATSTETKFIRGVRHTKIIGEIEYNGVRSPNIINYTGANLKVNKNVRDIDGDNNQNHGLELGYLRGQINNTNLR